MKNIKMFHLNDCGYCDKARKAMKELKQEDKYKDVVVETMKKLSILILLISMIIMLRLHIMWMKRKSLKPILA